MVQVHNIQNISINKISLTKAEIVEISGKLKVQTLAELIDIMRKCDTKEQLKNYKIESHGDE